MKILFIINSLKDFSGSERVAVQLANSIAKNFQYEITIINRDTSKEASAYKVEKEVNIECIDGNFFTFYCKLRLFLKTYAFDYVVVHNMGKLSLLCCFLPKQNKMISLEHIAFRSRPKFVQLFSKYLYGRLDQVVCLTQNDQNDFVEIHTNTCVIPNFSSFKLVKDINLSSKKIVAIGRLTDQKNFLHLLRAWHQIVEELPDWSLTIYGDGVLKSELLEYVINNDMLRTEIHKSVVEIDDVYKESAFFVMSSKYEGLPMVLIEAQAFGLPIISYNCPHGPADIISDGYNGKLVDNQNINALAEAILNLAQSPDLLKKLSENSLKNAERYQPKEIIKEWSNKVFTDK